MIHTQAKDAVTDQLKRSFAHNMDALCNNFRCLTCKPHFREFIDTHKFVNYWNIIDSQQRDVGMFKWSWELHNAVNKRLGKLIVDFDQAYDYYTNPNLGVCSNCSSVATERTGDDLPAVGFGALIQSKTNHSNGVSTDDQGEIELIDSDVLSIIDLYRNRGILPQNLR